MTLQSKLAILIALAYLLGAIPFGLIVGLWRGVDPRKAGSGNIGATNIGRLLGVRWFALVFALDFLKGFAPVVVASALVGREPVHAAWTTYALWLMVALGAVVGHVFSAFVKFKGGKGVATGAGVMLGLYPYFTWAGLIAVAVWIAVFMAWRYVSLASIVAAGAFPLAYVGVGLAGRWDILGARWPLLAFAVLIAALVIARHRTNIQRLLNGTELRARGK